MKARSQARSAARLAAVQALYQHAMEGTAEARLVGAKGKNQLVQEISAHL